MKSFFVFDVESIGLHGEAYAVAGGIYFEDGTVDKESEFLFCCDPIVACGMDDDRSWVEKNIPKMDPTHATPKEVREAFWNAWVDAKKSYPQIVMAGECVWPVETGFLTSCVADDPISRGWSGPYPLHEIASVMVSAGMDPMATYDRLDSELPKHNPLADARQSSRLLCEALDMIKSLAPVMVFLFLCASLSSCAYTNSKGSFMLGGKGAAKGGGSGEGSWAMVWNGENSFRDGAVLVGTVATGYFGLAATKATEATKQVAEKQSTLRHAAGQKTIQKGMEVHGQAYGTAVGAELPGTLPPAPPVAPPPGSFIP